MKPVGMQVSRDHPSPADTISWVPSSGQWRNWRGQGGEPPPWRAKCKSWVLFSWNFDV